MNATPNNPYDRNLPPDPASQPSDYWPAGGAAYPVGTTPTAAPITTTTPEPAPASSGGLLSKLNPLSGSSFLPNAGLIVVGVVLAVGALLISQRETVVQVAREAL